jgi:small subunit ribosomal protein S17
MITKKGIVTSAKMTGTVTVTVHRQVFHPLYKKSYRMSKKFLADSTGQDIGVGDEVLIAECRPLSKLKHFKIAEVLKKAPRVSDIQDEQAALKAIHRDKIAPEKKKEEVASTPAS